MIFLLMVLVSCSQSPKSNDTKKMEQLVTNIENVQQPQNITIEEALKINKDSLIQCWGKPLMQDSFIMNNSLTEFRIELYNVIPKDKYTPDEMVIEELTWSKDSVNNVTFWYERNDSDSKPIHHLIWNKGAEF